MHNVLDDFIIAYKDFFNIYKDDADFILILYRVIFFIPSFLTLIIVSLIVLALDGTANAFLYAKKEYNKDMEVTENKIQKNDNYQFISNFGSITADSFVNVTLIPILVLKFAFEGSGNFLVWIFTFSRQKVYS